MVEGVWFMTLTAGAIYVLYWVVRRAVAAGIRDARVDTNDSSEG